MASRKGLISMDQSANIADLPPVVSVRSVEGVGDDGAKVAAISVQANSNQGGDSRHDDDGSEFDASEKPPFTLGQIRAAIPKHCWERSMPRSLSYVAKDVAIVISLALVASFLDSWILWPLYWFAQGTMFWALFVLGHDCGHGSFSSNKRVNNIVGHFVHSFILVPYHGWRISHRTHHSNHGHVERDESWYPMTEAIYKTLDFWTKLGRTQFPLPLLAYPAYLWTRSPGKRGSHFVPTSDLFERSEWTEVTTSTACWLAMVAILAWAGSHVGFLWMLKLYIVPYLVNVMWLDAVTYLHHHGYEKKVPWYRGQEWSYMRGGLSTIDRDYGAFNKVHHDIGTHVVHHLFPAIPHYHLCEATAAVKPLLGKYYREPEKSGRIPIHLLPVMIKSFSEDHFVANEGDIVFYQKDTKSQ